LTAFVRAKNVRRTFFDVTRRIARSTATLDCLECRHHPLPSAHLLLVRDACRDVKYCGDEAHVGCHLRGKGTFLPHPKLSVPSGFTGVIYLATRLSDGQEIFFRWIAGTAIGGSGAKQQEV
jgi:hypothetical protein